MDSRNLHDRFQDSEMDARTYFLESDLALTVEERISLAELLPSVIGHTHVKLRMTFFESN